MIINKKKEAPFIHSLLCIWNELILFCFYLIVFTKWWRLLAGIWYSARIAIVAYKWMKMHSMFSLNWLLMRMFSFAHTLTNHEMNIKHFKRCFDKCQTVPKPFLICFRKNNAASQYKITILCFVFKWSKSVQHRTFEFNCLQYS